MSKIIFSRVVYQHEELVSLVNIQMSIQLKENIISENRIQMCKYNYNCLT